MTGDQDLQASTAYDSVYGRLLAKELAVWAKAGEVPDACVEPVVALLAFELANEYGVSDSRWQRLQFSAGNAEGELRTLVFPSYVSTTEVTDY